MCPRRKIPTSASSLPVFAATWFSVHTIIVSLYLGTNDSHLLFHWCDTMNLGRFIYVEMCTQLNFVPEFSIMHDVWNWPYWPWQMMMLFWHWSMLSAWQPGRPYGTSGILTSCLCKLKRPQTDLFLSGSPEECEAFTWTLALHSDTVGKRCWHSLPSPTDMPFSPNALPRFYPSLR